MSKRKEQQEKLAAIWATKPAGPAQRNIAATKEKGTVVENKPSKDNVDRKSATPLGLLSEALNTVTKSKTSSTAVDEIVVLPSEKCMPSFVRDRFEFAEDPDFLSLKESIKDDGQQLPILVRPHPNEVDFYQIAFGHRRHKACQELGFPVRAVVREMTDQELVIAQGKENNEREDLTFIEVALFAAHLGKGFTREVVMSAIGKNTKHYVSMLRSITDALPEDLIIKIGKAKGIGRPRWESLASHFVGGELASAGSTSNSLKDEFDALLQSKAFENADSSKRFDQVLSLLERSSKSSKPKPSKRILKSKDGKMLGELVSNDQALRLTVKRKIAPEFAEYLSNHLDKLIAEFEAKGEHS